ncbi:pheST operon leader peptide PheM [Mixta hanseatica]|uniref:pheST attenuator peptide n=1 Tax=Mixta hanseatica TaxID=2872648 RepID=A0ABY4RCI3_9GAMM|nr:pheST operon leader peptide PheM [Mixta hanseatica]
MHAIFRFFFYFST